ncbi:MAG: hypothetical protein EBT07_18845, partial [Actinobacteria bacterium]|nr:hypothetical protein [Actinomycetota bacterium]
GRQGQKGLLRGEEIKGVKAPRLRDTLTHGFYNEDVNVLRSARGERGVRTDMAHARDAKDGEGPAVP